MLLKLKYDLSYVAAATMAIFVAALAVGDLVLKQIRIGLRLLLERSSMPMCHLAHFWLFGRNRDVPRGSIL